MRDSLNRSAARTLQLPENVREEIDEIRRDGFILVCSIFSAVGLLLICIDFWSLGPQAWNTAIYTVPSLVLFFSSIPVLWLTGSIERAASLAITALCVGVFIHAYSHGGLMSPAVPILMVAPSLAAFFVSALAAIIVSLGCAAYLVLLYALSFYGLVDMSLKIAHPQTFVMAVVLTSVLLCIGLINTMFLKTNKRIQDQLTETSVQAMSANAAKDQFVATMSHEIRTPLNGVTGMTQLLLKSGLNDKQLSWAEMISASANSLSVILDDVLDISRLQAGALEISAEPFDLDALCRSSIGMVEVLARDKGLEISSHVSADAKGRYMGDPLRIRQILLNLIGNAVKFTDEGSVTLDVTKTDGKLSFSVTDTGMGISVRDQELIFERFMQSDQSDSRRHGGTGLGLAISRDLARLMDGEITVTSEPGMGSTFTFRVTLPADTSSAGEARIQKSVG
ncbi:hypothetical protein KHP62_12200 [Rhodobacteraceae bacterium NNCM2]|nr:hypothetical protein [Coraliihabitans acroporae]